MAVSLSAKELIKNGEFDNSFATWTEWKISDEVVYLKSIDDSGLLSGPNSARFEIQSGSTVDWHLQFLSACPIQKKANYYVRFMAGYEANSASYNVHFTIRSPNDPWPIYFQGTPEVSNFTGLGPFRFECDTTDGTTQLNFFLGGTKESVLWLDSVSVLEEGPFWQNTAFAEIQGSAVLKFDVYPDSDFYGIVGFSNGHASTEDDLAGAIQFHPDGSIRVADSTVFRSDAAVEYQYDTRYPITVEADLTAQRYSVSTKPPRKSETVIASGYAFRKRIDAINNLAVNVVIDPEKGGRPYTSMAVRNVKATPMTHVAGGGIAVPVAFGLENFPNPFNSATTIRYAVDKTGFIELVVYDASGRRVATLAKGIQEAGSHQAKFDARDLPSGVYLCTLKSAGARALGKMLLLK
jgi:hypothetical protein